MEKKDKLNAAQWVQWAGATSISTVVMSIAVMTWAEAHIYSRKEGEQNRTNLTRVENAHEKHEEKLDTQLREMRRKIDKIYELMIRKD